MQTGTGFDQIPFELQIDEFEPISVKPGLQRNVAIEPATGRLSVFVDVPPVMMPFLNNVGNGTQVAKEKGERSRIQCCSQLDLSAYRCMA